jgi:hypothetical protein
MRGARPSATAAIVALITLASLLSAAGRGGMRGEDSLAAAHIEGLPPEVRDAVKRWQAACGAPLAAEHGFSRSMHDKVSGARFVSLHFEHLRCRNRAAVCTAAGCLHEVYVSTDGHYRPALSVHAPDVELKPSDHSVAVEIACAPPAAGCPKLLRWNGARFTPR